MSYSRRKLQAALASVASGPPPTAVIELRTSYRRRFVKFRQLQTQFQPEVTHLLNQLPPASTDPDVIHDCPLYLPSALSADTRQSCSEKLVSMEKELRIGQCRDSLVQLRIKLNAKARLLNHKFVNVRHQLPNTRSQDLLSRTSTRIGAIAAKYCNSLTRLRDLDKDKMSKWRSEFLDLTGDDLRALAEPEPPKAATQERARELQERSLLNGNKLPEGYRTVSWVWRGSVGSDLEDQDGQSDYSEGT